MTDTNADPAVPQRGPGVEIDERENPTQASRTRATVARMGNETPWFEKPTENGDGEAPGWHQAEPAYPMAAPSPTAPASSGRRRRVWPYLAVIVVLGLAIVGVRQHTQDEERAQDRQAKTPVLKGRSGARLHADAVYADVVARWTGDKKRVVVTLWPTFDPDLKYLQLKARGKSASSTVKGAWFPKNPEIVLDLGQPFAAVTVQVAVGGKSWGQGDRPVSRTVRLLPTGAAYDAETGAKLPSDR